jgi:hypothetical protein
VGEPLGALCALQLRKVRGRRVSKWFWWRQVHELDSELMPKCYVFRGNKDVTTQTVQDFLGLGPRGMRGANPDQTARFIQPYTDCEFNINRS